MPDLEEHAPVPSRSMLTLTRVSFVRRCTVPRRSAVAAWVPSAANDLSRRKL